MRYDDFLKIYNELPKNFQATLSMFVYHLEHDFQRDDAKIYEQLQKYRKNKGMSWSRLAEKLHAEEGTLKHSNRNHTIRDSDNIAKELGISEYELYYGENEVSYQNRAVYDMKKTFEDQTEQMQKNLCFLAIQMYYLAYAPEMFDLSNDVKE